MSRLMLGLLIVGYNWGQMAGYHHPKFWWSCVLLCLGGLKKILQVTYVRIGIHEPQMLGGTGFCRRRFNITGSQLQFRCLLATIGLLSPLASLCTSLSSLI